MTSLQKIRGLPIVQTVWNVCVYLPQEYFNIFSKQIACISKNNFYVIYLFFSGSVVAAALVIFFTMKCLDFIKSIFLFVLSHSVMSSSLQPQALKLTRLLCQWNFSGKNTGAGCYFLLQGIYLTQGSKLRLLCLLLWQADSLTLNHQCLHGIFLMLCFSLK